MFEIELDKQGGLRAIFHETVGEPQSEVVVFLMESIELFANPDSARITDRYIELNVAIFNRLINLGLVELSYDIKMIAGSNRLHYFIKEAEVVKPIVYW